MRRLAVGLAIFGVAFVAFSLAIADDQDIAREITEKLKQEQAAGTLQGFDISLQVEDGKVLLEGYVASEQQLALALDVAREAVGVTEVACGLDIKESEPQDDHAIAQGIARQLAELKQEGLLKGFRIGVDVVDGTASLDGTVATEEQKQLALQAASEIDGVLGVVDQLAVTTANAPVETPESIAATEEPASEEPAQELAAAPELDAAPMSEIEPFVAAPVSTFDSQEATVEPEAIETEPVITDAQIARQIATNLKAHQDAGLLRGFSIDMSVLQGIVKFSGHVSNDQQIALAMDSATNIEGVQDVVNELNVRPVAPAQAPIARAESPAIPRMEPQPVTSEPQRSAAVAVQPRTQTPAPINVAPAPVEPQVASVENAVYRAETKQAATPQDSALMDRIIGVRLMEQLQQAKDKGQLQGFGIGVHVHERNVRLSGNVSTPEQRLLALSKARQIGGVNQVIDDLTVTQTAMAAAPQVASAPAVAPAPVSRPLGQLAPVVKPKPLSAASMEIAHALEMQLQQQEAMGRLAGCDLDLKVKEANVEIAGVVGSPEQQQLILQLAAQIPGVERVDGDLTINANAMQSMTIPVSAYAPAYPQGYMAQPGMQGYMAQPGMQGQMVATDQTPRPMGAPQMIAYGAAAAVAAPFMAINQMSGGGSPAHLPGPGQAVTPARYDHPNLPGYAWPSYAAHPNYAAVTYPKQYSPTAWPYIGPFYPYPQVPLGWRKVTLKWDDGWWQLNFKSK